MNPFRLAAVERLRATRLAERAKALAQAQGELVQAQTRRDALRIALTDPGCGGDPWTPGPDEVGPGPWDQGGDQQGGQGGGQGGLERLRLAADHRERLREELVRAGERVEAAREVQTAAVASWHGARADLRAVEALHERYQVALAAAAARLDQRTLDDLAATSMLRQPGGERR